MAGWKGWVLDILTVAMVCRLLLLLLPKKELAELVCGVALTVVLLQPLTGLRSEDFPDIRQYLPESPEALLAAGTETAGAAKSAYITQQYEAYILDKAKAMGADIQPRIRIDGEGLPVSACIRGDMDPQIQKQLEQILIRDMGITKENQQWTGNPENGN